MKVLILGCGFAGLEVAKTLRKRSKELEICAIDRRTRFEYLAALPEILSGKVTPDDISVDLNKFATSINAEYINAEVVDIDFIAKTVKISTSEISYDYLVLAVGAEQTFFGIPGAEEYSYSVNTMEGALRTREALDKLDSIEESSVAVIGAGLTGVEVAGELLDYFKKRAAAARIYLVEMMPMVLPAFSHRNLANSVRNSLSGRGVEIATETAVQEVGADAILFTDGEKIPYDIIIWTAGIRPNSLVQKLALPKTKGWLHVDSNLRVPGQKGTFAVGDTIYFERDGARSGQNVEEAERQGKVAAGNLIRAIKGEKLKRYRPKNTVQNPRAFISLGENKAVIYFAGKVITVCAYKLKKYVEHRYMRGLQ